MSKYFFFLCLFIATTSSAQANVIYDEQRERQIPIAISQPKNTQLCSAQLKCPVAFVSAGYGVAHTKYSFVSKMLVERGYLVVAIRHELPSDPPLSVTGDLYQTRSENWQRGSNTLRFLQKKLAQQYPHYDFDQLLLVGHSNGGDISAWLTNEGAPFVSHLITYDHRRVPLPRTSQVKVLSIRASDFPADKGVLPRRNEIGAENICVHKVEQAKHNDMSDYGPDWLKNKMVKVTQQFLQGATCEVIHNGA